VSESFLVTFFQKSNGLLLSPQAAAASSFNAGIRALRRDSKLHTLISSYRISSHEGAKAMQTIDKRYILTLAGVFGAAAASAASLPALYTAAQATAGQAVFAQNCAMCHGAALQGMAGPALVGQRFASAAKDYTVGAIFGEIAEQMPAEAPGSLTHDQYVDALAFILSKNGYPAGSTALAYETSLGSSVPLVSQVK
jgi:mono/diheme cytochrome c family protein